MELSRGCERLDSDFSMKDNRGKTVSDKKEMIIAYKGFSAEWKCRSHQYAIGETYTHDGKVEICSSGFHACEYPLDCFSYYSPSDSKYAIVEMITPVVRHSDDTKIASASITIYAELRIPELVNRAVEWIMSRIESTKKESNTGYRSAATNTGDQSAATNTGDRSAATNTGDQSAATNTGDRSAATNTGYQSAATNTGYQSAATNTGYRSAATNTGYQSAATNTGDQSAATVSGKESVAIATGYKAKAKAGEGGAVVLCNRDDEGVIRHIRASKVGENGIKPYVFYVLNDSGEFQGVTE
jgi:hypothetical protein